MTRRDWLWLSTATMALYNVVYWRRVLPVDAEGMALSLVPIIPSRLSRSAGRILLDGQEELQEDELIRVRRTVWPSVTEELGTVLRLAREVFAAAWAQGAYSADYWENGGSPQIVLTSDQAIPNALADQISDRWATKRREGPGKPAVLGHGAKVDQYGANLSSSDSGAAGDRTLAAIARYFGVPAWPVNAPSAAGSLVYSNTESAGADLIRYTLRGYLGPIEDGWSEELPGSYILGRRVALDVSHLTMGTLLERFQAYQIATGGQRWMTPEEVRRELHLPPDPGLLEGSPAPAVENLPQGVTL